MSMINTTSEHLKAIKFSILSILVYEHLKFHAQLSWAWKKFYNLGTWCLINDFSSIWYALWDKFMTVGRILFDEVTAEYIWICTISQWSMQYCRIILSPSVFLFTKWFLLFSSALYIQVRFRLDLIMKANTILPVTLPIKSTNIISPFIQ